MLANFSTECTANTGPPASTPAIQRDLRIARALRLRRADIRDEMASALRQREDAYRLADALLDEFDDLATRDKGLRAGLAQVELRLQRAGAYFVTDEQVTIILNEIGEVGADTRRFCKYLGVEAIAKIPAHEFQHALAALDAKKRRRAA
jgi:hypothetical protein